MDKKILILTLIVFFIAINLGIYIYRKRSKSEITKSSLKDRLFKSKKKLGDGLSSLLIGKKKIDDELLEDLEILLISSDIGIQTTDKISENMYEMF